MTLLSEQPGNPVAITTARCELCAVMKQDLVFAFEERLKFSDTFDVDDC